MVDAGQPTGGVGVATATADRGSSSPAWRLRLARLTRSTRPNALLELAHWPTDAGCTHAAVESTGVYWQPVYNLLEGVVELILRGFAPEESARKKSPDPKREAAR